MNDRNKSKYSPIVNHPPHYQGASKIGRQLLRKHFGISEEVLNGECIDFLESDRKYCVFHLGNAIKYLWRCGAKGDAIEDILKALWYLRRWVATPDTEPCNVALMNSVSRLITDLDRHLDRSILN